MKLGDLVQLSSYGKKLKCLSEYRDEVGILITQNLVMWSNKPGFKCPVNRRDIRRARND